VQINDGFRFAGEMRHAGERGMHLRGRRAANGISEQPRHGKAAHAEAGLPEKLAARLEDLMFNERVHERMK
jgi:hypothetical protein